MFNRKPFYDESMECWKLPLTKGEFALISKWDVEFLSQWSWSYHVHKKAGPKYARRNVKTPFGNKTVFLHRVVAERWGILGISNFYIDHKNNNGLDCRGENLRLATLADNNRNVTRRRHNTSGFKGVSLYKANGKWTAQITLKGKKTHLGYFDTAEIAYAAYCAAAEKYFGEFARRE